jgi:hypothetical protein
MIIAIKEIISGFRMFSNTPLFHPGQKAQTYPLYNLLNYCKISLSDGKYLKLFSSIDSS